MENTAEQVGEKLLNTVADMIKNLKRLNVVVIGKTGAGKSTLINTFFRDNIVETGVGRPVTTTVRQITKRGCPITIYDTPGFELSEKQQETLMNDLFAIIKEGIASNDINKAIHCIWYCVNVGSNRTFEDSEVKWLKKFTEENKLTRVPIIVVLTQAFPKKKAEEMKDSIESENLDIVNVVPLLAQDIDYDGEYTARSYGLDKLVQVMSAVLPDELQHTLQNLQKASLEQKKLASQAVVVTAATGAFGEGFTPIPFSDAALLIPTQVLMIAGITVLFGLSVSKSILTSFVSSTIGSTGATVLGKSVVANLVKLIPGVGTLVGGMISGTTATLLTTALGEAYIKVMEKLYKGEMTMDDLTSAKGLGTMRDLFEDELKNRDK